MGSWLPRIKFWYGWCGFIKFQCGSKKGRGSKFCMHDVDDVKFWRGCSGSIKYWQGAKSCIGKKQYSIRPVAFHYFQSVPYMYPFLTFVSLYSLCSFHIHSNWGRTKIIYRP